MPLKVVNTRYQNGNTNGGNKFSAYHNITSFKHFKVQIKCTIQSKRFTMLCESSYIVLHLNNLRQYGHMHDLFFWFNLRT